MDQETGNAMVWHTWLGYFGLLFGVTAPIVFGTPTGRSAAIGLGAGLALMVLWNLVDPNPTPCLQAAKGWDILRAYSLECAIK
jgi:hypothetical protein